MTSQASVWRRIYLMDVTTGSCDVTVLSLVILAITTNHVRLGDFIE